jgi:hypothetical protein
MRGHNIKTKTKKPSLGRLVILHVTFNIHLLVTL